MDPIIQTLTLATILLIIGIICMVLGVVGLVWKAGHDRRRMEKSRNTMTSDANADRLQQESSSDEEQSLV
jgi:FtsZ-interacting cell division protein ZipA